MALFQVFWKQYLLREVKVEPTGASRGGELHLMTDRKADRTTEQPEEEAEGKRAAETQRKEKEAKSAQKRARARREGQCASADVGRT